jgi:hypothetical protein
MTVVLPAALLRRYRRFSLYNSPYPAHDRGCAVDLYPGTDVARSPVAGEVLETRTVRCPGRPYAVDHDHLILVAVDADGERSPDAPTATGDDACADLVARILHVDPSVEPGETVAVGDPLGGLVRSGFFGPWVDNHLHLGFRRADQHLHRAGGSRPLVADVPVTPLAWDGTGRVVETGRTYALLDSPTHPAPGEYFVGIASDGPDPVALDGGLAHYTGGGALPGPTVVHGDGAAADGGDEAVAATSRRSRDLSLLGERVGVAEGRDVTWSDLALVVTREGEGEYEGGGDATGGRDDGSGGRDGTRRATGLSLFAARDAAFGAKLVFHEGHDLTVGDGVRVAVEASDDPLRLG